jgi:hypothetical protein
LQAVAVVVQELTQVGLELAECVIMQHIQLQDLLPLQSALAVPRYQDTLKVIMVPIVHLEM